MIRDPYDVAASYSSWRARGFNKFISDPSPRFCWGKNVKIWEQRTNTVVIRFEDLLKDPAGEICYARECLNLDFDIHPGSKIPSFEELNRLDPAFFSHGGGGRDRLSGKRLRKISLTYQDLIDKYYGGIK